MGVGRCPVEDLVSAPDPEFWSGRRVLVTGHTGFKGAWLSLWLLEMGAVVRGYALAPEPPALFIELDLAERVDHLEADIRDTAQLSAALRAFAPDVVIHMAAQSLVRASYADPLGTWSINLMGTANLLDAVRGLDRPCAVVVVTTDKVYENLEIDTPYAEDGRLGGFDPYSASKAACEILASSWYRSFGQADAASDVPWRMATARSGNVIGGGDWAADRLFPDLARAFGAGHPMSVRNPDSTRPWQHVLDPLAGYLMLAEALTLGHAASGSAWNFGPEPRDGMRVRDVLAEARRHWRGGVIVDAPEQNAPHEAGRLALDITQAREGLGWRPRWNTAQAIARTVVWYREHNAGTRAPILCIEDLAAFTDTDRCWNEE